MNNIRNIYQHARKCDDQQNLKGIIDDEMFSNPEGVTDNISNVPMTSTPVKKSSAMKSLCFFTNILGVKLKIEKRRIVAAKSKRRAMKVGTIQWGGRGTKRAFKNK